MVGRNKPGPPPATLDAVWAGVSVRGPDQCWPWTKRRNAKGYGLLVVAGQAWRAHRAVYVAARGKIPEGQIVRHRCDNPSCCNPAHLELGTVADNNRDARERGRHVAPRGLRHGKAKLSDRQVARIRMDPRKGTAIAADYGISPSTVSMIRSGYRRADP